MVYTLIYRAKLQVLTRADLDFKEEAERSGQDDAGVQDAEVSGEA